MAHSGGGVPVSSTTQFFYDFFPTAHKELSHGFPALWELLQPGWMAEQCQEQHVLVTLPGGSGEPVQLRNPSLLPFQLAGILVGLVSAWILAGPKHSYLRFALAFFALMNLSSVACHNFSSRGSPLWHAVLLLDVVFTGSSSICLILSQVLEAPTSAASAKTAHLRCWAVLLALLTAAIFGLQLPWVPEAMYLGTTAVAAAVVWHRMIRQWGRVSEQRHAQLRYHMLALLAVTLMLACLPLDPLLCMAAGPAFGTTQLLFFGSDLGFAAVAALAAAGKQSSSNSLKAE